MLNGYLCLIFIIEPIHVFVNFCWSAVIIDSVSNHFILTQI